MSSAILYPSKRGDFLLFFVSMFVSVFSLLWNSMQFNTLLSISGGSRPGKRGTIEQNIRKYCKLAYRILRIYLGIRSSLSPPSKRREKRDLIRIFDRARMRKPLRETRYLHCPWHMFDRIERGGLPFYIGIGGDDDF